MSFLKGDPGGKKGCGLSWLWFRESDEFKDACLIHDFNYDEHHRAVLAGEIDPKLQKSIDEAFLSLMKRTASIEDGWKKARMFGRAYLYYGLARTVGRLVW